MPTFVLVIDNDKATRDMLSILLHDEGGCAVIAADGPASALDIQAVSSRRHAGGYSASRTAPCAASRPRAPSAETEAVATP